MAIIERHIVCHLRPKLFETGLFVLVSSYEAIIKALSKLTKFSCMETVETCLKNDAHYVVASNILR